MQHDQECRDVPVQLLARDYFGTRAARYRQSHGNAEALAQMIELAGVEGDEFMLDVGTGPGHVACTFAPHVRQVVASDLSLRMLHEVPIVMEEKGVTNIWRVAVDSMAIPFQDNSFDLVTSRLAVAHFPEQTPAVQEMARVCKRGGKVLIVDVMGPEDPEAQTYIDTIERLRDSSHVSNHSNSEWLQAYESAGLEVMKTLITQGRTRNLEAWMDRADTSPENRARVYAMLQNPPDAVKRHVDMGQDDEGTWYFSTAQLRILGCKR